MRIDDLLVTAKRVFASTSRLRTASEKEVGWEIAEMVDRIHSHSLVPDRPGVTRPKLCIALIASAVFCAAILNAEL